MEFNTRMLARRLNLSLFKIERKDAVGLMQWQQQNAIRLGILKQRTGGQ